MKIISSLLILSCLVLVAFSQANVRSIDGTNNNINNPNWGAASAPLLRNIPYTYDDGFQSPTGGLNSKLLSPRLISNVIIGRKSEYTIPADLETTDLLTFWAQFIDHDLTFSLDTKDATGVCNPFNINIPKGDPFFDSASLGGQTMQFCRLAPVPGSGTNASNPLNAPNILTAYVDGSMVYGYTNIRATALRSFQGGLMKVSKGIDGDFLPLNNDGKGNTLIDMANAAAKFPATELYAGGDLRANENPVLLSLHTLFVREHNRRAKLLPNSMNDEAKYQQARKMVIASIQKITYTDFLPAILGIPFPAYPGYNNTANAGITAFFSTSAYRFGHDQLNNVILRLDPLGNSITPGSVLLRDIFFDIPSFNVCGASPYLRGAAVHPQRLIDTVIEDDVRIFLYGGGPATAFDLPARNMQRARDVGLGFYNDARKAYGLPTCTTFSCVTNDTNLVTLLNNLYGTNNVSFLDSFIGGLMEPKANKKAKLGTLFSTAVIEQFQRCRNGDRFWYENPGVLTSAELKEIQTTSLGDIIKRNTDSKLMPASVFNRQNVAPEAIYNPPNNTPWIIGIIIVTIIAAILLIVVIGLCFAKQSGGSGGRRVEDNQLYDKLMTDK